MSITSILNGHSFDSLKEYIRNHVPRKDDFCSSTGYPAFSKDIPIKIPGSNQSTHEAAIIGEVSDYVFCLEILRFVKKQKVDNYNYFFQVIDNAYRNIRELDSEHSDTIQRYYSTLKSGCFLYVMGNDVDLRTIIQYAYQMYKIKSFHRISREYRALFWDQLMEPCNENITNEVIRFVEIFRKSFFEDGIIREKSTVVLHPRFGTHTSPAGIADIYVDGVLYDFKSSKKNGFNWLDVGQVYGYYILHRLSQKYDKDTVSEKPVQIKKVTGIAVYYSRFGDIEACDLHKSNSVLYSKELEFLAKMMDNHRRELDREFIERMKISSAPLRWRKLELSRKSTMASDCSPETVGYGIGDALYEPSLGKGYVVRFAERDGRWHVFLALETSKAVWVDINKTILLNWDSLDDEFPDCNTYFIS